MNTTAMTLNSLKDNKINVRKFRIPLYQRTYAWEEGQVRQLLDDMKNAYINKDDAYFYRHFEHRTHGGRSILL